MTFQRSNLSINNLKKDMDYLNCKKCDEILPITNFRINSKGEHRTICIECFQWKRGGNGMTNEELSVLLLERMGYNTQENIHEQFMEKHKEKFDYVND